MPNFSRPITDEQRKQLIENAKPSQDAVNQAANDLIWQLMQRVEELENSKPTLAGKPSVQPGKRKSS